jgi:hypothetical protein
MNVRLSVQNDALSHPRANTQMPLESGEVRTLVQALSSRQPEGWRSQAVPLAEDYLRATLQGIEFANDVAQLKLGDDGFFYQLKDRESTFQGATLPVSSAFIDDEAASQLVWEALSAYRNFEAQVLLIYAADYAENDSSLFLGYHPGGQWDDIRTAFVNDDGDLEFPRFERGMFRLEPPLFARFDLETGSGIAGVERGSLLMFRVAQGQNLLLRLPRLGMTPSKNLKC